METVQTTDITYIGAFITFKCGFKCSYCINHYDKLKTRKEMWVYDWIRGLNRLAIDRNRKVPITIQGGEPSKYKDWVKLIYELREEYYVDILTNLDFDEKYFWSKLPPSRFQRDVPYASIRVSYHPEYHKFDKLLDKVKRWQDAGYDMGIFVIDHPTIEIDPLKIKAKKAGIDFRTKEFLGVYNGTLYGMYKYPDAVNSDKTKKAKCKSTELLIASDGYIYRCHRDLYAREHSVAHILDENLNLTPKFRACDKMGQCNPCDIKLKNNRFQKFGTCSVEINDRPTIKSQ